MKNFKKVLALALAVVMLVSMATVASAVTSDYYTDAGDIDYAEAVDVLGAIGVLNGFPDDSFRPDATITRAQAAKIIAMFDNNNASINGLYTSANPFSDCVGNWAESYIAYCAKTGIIAGIGGDKFAPDANVTGVQFLKMALVVLGYDAKVEGLEGKNWDVNTLALAKRVGLTETLGVKFDYSADLKRQEAAVIMLDALRAETVVYGTALGVNASKVDNAIATWTTAGGTVTFSGVNVNGAIYMTVAGAVQTGEQLMEGWGLAEGYTEDAFYRPYRTWTLNGSTIKTYMYTPKAEYHTQYTGCDVLVDLGVAKTSGTTKTIAAAYINGWERNDVVPAAGLVLSHTLESSSPCAAKSALISGAQGTLSQVFYVDAATAAANNTVAGYRITEIDTWLGKVTSAKVVSTNRDGHLSTYSLNSIEMYTDTNANDHNTNRGSCWGVNPSKTVATSTNELKKGDYVLLTYSIKTDAVESVKVVTPVAGSLTGYKVDTYPSQTRVDDTYIPDSAHFHLGYTESKTRSAQGANRLFFYDNYDNVIGMIAPSASAMDWLVIDRLWLQNVAGNAVLYADVVTLDAKIAEGVIVAELDGQDADYYTNWWANGNTFAFKNASLYNNLNNFFVAENEYYIYDAHCSTNPTGTTVTITKGDPEVVYAAAAATTKTRLIATDAATKYLIHENDGTYTAVTGFRAIDSLNAAHAQYVDGDNDGVAEIVYLFGDIIRAGDNAVVYVTGPASDWVEMYNGVAWNKMLVYVDGVATEVYVLESDVTTYFEKTGWTAAGDAGFYTFHYETVGSRSYVTVVEDVNGTNMTVLNAIYTVQGIDNDVLSVLDSSVRHDFALADGVAVYSVRIDGTVVKEDAAKYVETYGLDNVKLIFSAGEVVAIYSLETIAH